MGKFINFARYKSQCTKISCVSIYHHKFWKEKLRKQFHNSIKNKIIKEQKDLFIENYKIMKEIKVKCNIFYTCKLGEIMLKYAYYWQWFTDSV